MDAESLKNQVRALFANIVAWVVSFFFPVSMTIDKRVHHPCVSISGPGGFEKLRMVPIPGENIVATVGYNVPGIPCPFVKSNISLDSLSPDLVLVKTAYFSVNYADICIRWGLYESANRFVGWPIVPGFDFSGEIEWAGSNTDFKKGEKIFGVTLFGAYSSRILVPGNQLRKAPTTTIPLELWASVPAVAATALHAISLAGAWPAPLVSCNHAVLIHSAGGGVGSMLIQMCKIVGYSPIVAVVGSSHKVGHCSNLGADIVVDKSGKTSTQIWKEVESASSRGYAAIFDANGISTLQQSYNHLAANGKLVIYGFHSNVPKATDLLSPTAWLEMIYRLVAMPKFDPMALVLESKCVTGFNLSFFSEETDLIKVYMDQIVHWVQEEKLKIPDVTVYDMYEIRKAHQFIQTGQSIGKIVIKVPT